MKTWRERIAEARERGSFSREDYEAWQNPKTCLVGEQRQRYGLDFPLHMVIPIGPTEHGLQVQIVYAIARNSFDEVERLLDMIEDQALNLKRSGLVS